MNSKIRGIIVLCTVVFFVMTGISIISPVLPFYAKELGASAFMVGLLVGALASARIVLDLPAGVAGDRFGNWRMMQTGLVLIASSSFMAVIAFNYWMLLGVRVVEGIGSAFYVTSSLAALARTVPETQRGKYMSLYVATLLIGQVIGPSIGGAVTAVWGLRAPFAVYGLLALIGMVLIALVQLPVSGGDIELGRIDWKAVKNLFKNRSFMRVNIGTMSAFFLRSGILLTVSPLYFNAKLGFGGPTIGLLISVAAITSATTMVPSGILADRYGRKIPFVASFVLSALIMPLFMIPTDLLGVIIVYALFGLALGLQGPMAAWSTDLVEKQAMGTAMGLYRTISDIGFLLGPTILAAVLELGRAVNIIELPFFVTLAWMLVAANIIVVADDPIARNAKKAKAIGKVPIT